MNITQFPEECISHIISFTSPRDACRLSLVCPLFRSASDSDVVWDKFLASACRDIISQLVVEETTLNSMSKKALYFHLCDNPIIMANGKMSFSLDKPSGKKCLMVGARDLIFGNWIGGDGGQIVNWRSLPESRFSEVAMVNDGDCFHVKACVDTSILSSQTTYGAYLVFKYSEQNYGLDPWLVEVCVCLREQQSQNSRKSLISKLDCSKDRENGWKEIEMGQFFNEQGEDGPVLCTFRDFRFAYTWTYFTIEGIEIRPTATRFED